MVYNKICTIILFFVFIISYKITANPKIDSIINLIEANPQNAYQLIATSGNQCYAMHINRLTCDFLREINKLDFSNAYLRSFPPDHFKAETDFWQVRIYLPNGKTSVLYMQYEVEQKILIFDNTFARLSNVQFYSLLETLNYLHKVNYSCKSFEQYRKIKQTFTTNAKRNGNHILAPENYNTTWDNNETWGYGTFELHNICYLNHKKMMDSINNLVAKNLSAPFLLGFDFEDIVGQKTMKQRNTEMDSINKIRYPVNPNAIKKAKPGGGKIKPQVDYGKRGYSQTRDFMPEQNTIPHSTCNIQFNVECSQATFIKLNVGTNKSSWQILQEPDLRLYFYTNDQTSLLQILDSMQ